MKAKMLMLEAIPQEAKDRFWTLIGRDDKTGCWPWMGPIRGNNYGQFYIKGDNKVLAHRMAFVLSWEDLTDDRLVCHYCDNPICCNPFHLFLGSNSDNQQDMVRKGRCQHLTNSYRYKHKLNTQQVNEIRKSYIPRIMSQRMLAKKYGVSQAIIGDLLLGHTYMQPEYQEVANVG